jgi:hypothetical protein
MSLSPGHLAAYDVVQLSGIALSEGLAHAQDGQEALLERLLDLLVHGLIGLAEILPSFAVPDNNIFASQIQQHIGRYLTGECALVLPMEVLGGKADVRSLDGFGHRGSRGEGRAEHDVPFLDVRDERDELRCKLTRLRRGHVHLPVAGEDGTSLRVHGKPLFDRITGSTGLSGI